MKIARLCLMIGVQALLMVHSGYCQEDEATPPEYELYLNKTSLTETLLSLNKSKEARELFETVDKRFGGLEYDYLNALLNQQKHSIQAHSKSILALAIAKNGNLLATGSSDSTITLWDTSTLTRVGILTGHQGPVTCLDFSPDGLQLISGSRDQSVIVWDVNARTQITQLKRDDWRGIYDVNFDPKAEQIGVTTWTFVNSKVKGILHFFETKNWTFVQENDSPSPHPVSALAYSPDGKRVAYGTWGLSLHYFDFVQRNVKWMLNMMDNYEYSSVTSLDISPDSKQLIIGTKDTKVRIVDTNNGAILFEPEPYTWHNDEVNDVKFSPDGKLFASSSIDETINVGNSDTGQPLSLLLGHTSSVTAIAFHPKKQVLYSVSTKGRLNVWDLENMHEDMLMGCPDPGYGRGAFHAEVNTAGQQLALACGSRVQLWDLVRKKRKEIDISTYYGLDFIGDKLIVGQTDGKISIWDLTSENITLQFEAHDGYIQKIKAINSQQAISASGTSLNLWDLTSGKEKNSYISPAYINSFVLHDKVVILGLSGGGIQVIDLKSWEVEHEWEVDSSPTGMAISKENSKLAVGQSGGEISVYDLSSFKLVNSFKDQEGPISSLAFSARGDYLISAASKNTQTVKFWSLEANRKTLSLHKYSDIAEIRRLGSENHFLLSDKHGRVFLIRF